MMNKKVSFIFTVGLTLFIWDNNSYGQGSSVADSVRAMIERSQATSQFEQTAPMQMAVQFGEFLAGLSSDPPRKSQLEAALLAVLNERAELD